MVKKIGLWLLDRADEPSTWRGIFVIGSALGFITLPPEQATLLAAGLAMIFGGVDVVSPEPQRRVRRSADLDDIDIDELSDDEYLSTNGAGSVDFDKSEGSPKSYRSPYWKEADLFSEGGPADKPRGSAKSQSAADQSRDVWLGD